MDKSDFNNKVTLNGNVYYVPDKIKYRQYRDLLNLLESVNIDISDTVDVSINPQIKDIYDKPFLGTTIKIGKILIDIIKKDIVPEFFSLILVSDADKNFNKEEILKDMYELTDEDMIGLVSYFLAERGRLMNGLVVKLGDLIPKNLSSSKS